MSIPGLGWNLKGVEPPLPQKVNGSLDLKGTWRETKFNLTLWVILSTFQNIITFGRLKGLKGAIDSANINLKEIQTFDKQPVGSNNSHFCFHLNQSIEKIQSFRQGTWNRSE